MNLPVDMPLNAAYPYLSILNIRKILAEREGVTGFSICCFARNLAQFRNPVPTNCTSRHQQNLGFEPSWRAYALARSTLHGQARRHTQVCQMRSISLVVLVELWLILALANSSFTRLITAHFGIRSLCAIDSDSVTLPRNSPSRL